MKSRTNVAFALVSLLAMALASCGTQNNGDGSTSKGDIESSEVKFNYSDVTYTPDYGSGKTNDEEHPYSTIRVNPTENTLREDFAMGVDGSMIQAVEEAGGIYYNQEGKEQDVFQILKESGVNFFRVRLWNNPANKFGSTYGGGGNDETVDINLCKRAKKVGMNVLVDFHYSDFWADPDDQQVPKAWATNKAEEIPSLIEEFTKTTLQNFKDAGVEVDAIQVGNEINNGMCGYEIDWNKTEESFDYIASMLNAGIRGAKAVNENIYTMVHLANGGNTAEFSTFFSELEERNVPYDIIGASFYPYLSGNLEGLQENLNNVSKLTGKPVVIAETSWGFTDDSVTDVTANQYYSANYEDTGGYLTSEQAQATEIRDLVNILSKVPDNKGLGIFYWEPAWLPVKGTGWATAVGQSYKYTGSDSHKSDYTDGLATWCNQGLFSYTGKALSSLNVFKYLSSGEGNNSGEEKVTKARTSTLDVTLNLAADETLPETGTVETDFDAIRSRDITWDAASVEECKTKGTHVATGKLNGQFDITANVSCIENFIVDPGFENQGTTDVVKTPWNLRNVTPSGDKVAKLDRKTDTRSGTTDFNWYHSSEEFTFDLYQEIKLPAGTYHLATYIMSVAYSVKAHTKLEVYFNDGTTEYVADMKTVVDGWNNGYKSTDLVTDDSGKPVLSGIKLDSEKTITVGFRGAGPATLWGHNDDWSLVAED